MNLCYLCPEYPPFPHGGIGSATETLARALAARGHRVRVAGVYPVPAIEEREIEGVRVTRLPANGGRLGWIRDRAALWRLVARWAREGEIEAIEAPDWEGWTAGWPSLPVPVIVRLHGSLAYFGAEMNQAVSRAAWMLESNAFHRADYCSSTSRYAARVTERLFGPHGSGIRVIPNFVEIPQEEAEVRRAPRRVVFAGTLAEKKGVIPLMAAWGEVQRSLPDAELHVYGKDGAHQGGSMREALTRMLPEGAAVTFHGAVSRREVAEAFRRCRAAVFPSLSEAFSVAPLEAMAQGCPVICSNRHSGPELIESGSDGLLVDPANPREIGEAILRLLRDEETAVRLGAAGGRKVRERFSTAAAAGQHERFLESCIQNYRRSASQMRALSRQRFTAHA